MKLRIKKKLMLALAVPVLLAANSAQAHIVGITWNILPSGDVRFDALHWHGDRTAAQIGTAALIVNGQNFGFTSVTNNVTSMPGIDGLDNNPLYSHWDGTHLNATMNTNAGFGTINDWLHVVVPSSTFKPTGELNTLNSTPGPNQLSQWTLTGGITSIDFRLPPPPPPVGARVPDGGSTAALLAATLLGLGAMGRKRLGR